MLAYQNDQDAIVPWAAGITPVRGVIHPANVESLWADVDLNAAGLYRMQHFVAPAGQAVIGTPSYTITNSVAVETWATAPAPVAVPQTVSDRQFFQQLAIQAVISQDEALAAVKTGTLPASLVTLVNALPTDQQFGANMLLCGATSFDRKHPMVAVLGQAFGWTDAQLDDLWTAAAAL